MDETVKQTIEAIRQHWATMAAIITWGIVAIAVGTVLEFIFCAPRPRK